MGFLSQDRVHVCAHSLDDALDETTNEDREMWFQAEGTSTPHEHRALDLHQDETETHYHPDDDQRPSHLLRPQYPATRAP